MSSPRVREILYSKDLDPTEHEGPPGICSDPSDSASVLVVGPTGVRFDLSMLPENWVSNDPEDIEFIYRMSWLPYIEPEQRKWTLERVFRCASLKTHKKFSMESYTISERIINTIRFQETQPQCMSISRYLAADADRLVKNLEFYPGGIGNHIVNNLRALIFFGWYINHIALIRMVCVLLENVLPLLCPRGALREGSSHYQAIFTTWLVDIYSLLNKAKIDHSKVIKKFLTINASLTNSLNRLTLPSEQFLCIGDISPDISPSELRRTLSEIDRRTSSYECLFLSPHEELTNIPGLYGRLSYNNFELLFSSKHYNWITMRGHHHNDEGAFVLLYKGTIIIGDPGRRSYLSGDVTSTKQVLMESHNVVRIKRIENGGTTDVTPQSWSFVGHFSNISNDNSSTLLYTSDDGKLRLERQFDFLPNQVKITDSITHNDGRNDLVPTSYFHVSPSFRPLSEKRKGSPSRVLTNKSIIVSFHASTGGILECESYSHSDTYGRSQAAILIKSKGAFGGAVSVSHVSMLISIKKCVG